MKAVRILGISGSLRKDSYNTATLRAAATLLPEGATLEIFNLSQIPLYNEDVRNIGYPPIVLDFRKKIEAADAVPWTKPDHLLYDPNGKLPRVGAGFKKGFHVALADGSVRFVRSTVDEKTLRSLITINGGEVIENDP